MNKKIFYVAGMLTVLVGTSMLAASASDSMDPNIRRMYHGRMQVQVTDESPIVHVIQPPPSPHYNIQVPSIQTDAGPSLTIQQMPAPANAGYANPPANNILGPNGLPAAGIQSNMSSLAPSRAPNLPNGRVGNHVSTHVAANMLSKPAGQSQQAQARGPIHVAQSPTVAVYALQQPVSGAQSNSVRTSATGKMMGRGSLLH